MSDESRIPVHITVTEVRISQVLQNQLIGRPEKLHDVEPETERQWRELVNSQHIKNLEKIERLQNMEKSRLMTLNERRGPEQYHFPHPRTELFPELAQGSQGYLRTHTVSENIRFLEGLEPDEVYHLRQVLEGNLLETEIPVFSTPHTHT